jgi:hypothetical protein
MVVVNHTYKEQSLFPRDIVSGGTGSYYSSDSIWILGRQQEKDGTEVTGYNFIINIEKSRHVREKSKIPITVSFEGGISKWSGLLEVAEGGGYIRKPKVGWYEAINPKTGEVLSEKLLRAKDIVNNGEFWKMMFDKTDLAGYIKETYTVSNKTMLSEVPDPESEFEEGE